jgi:hypothetical protein
MAENGPESKAPLSASCAAHEQRFSVTLTRGHRLTPELGYARVGLSRFRDSLDGMERQTMSTPNRPRLLSETPYSVPRRYDLATLFFVTTAYALLFAVLRLIRLPPKAVGTSALLLALVGIAQAVLFKGKAPRAASIAVGTIFVGIVYVMAIPGPMSIENLTPLLLSSALAGPIVGYLCGVLVGGVFLVADVARKLVA